MRLDQTRNEQNAGTMLAGVSCPVCQTHKHTAANSTRYMSDRGPGMRCGTRMCDRRRHMASFCPGFPLCSPVAHFLPPVDQEKIIFTAFRSICLMRRDIPSGPPQLFALCSIALQVLLRAELSWLSCSIHCLESRDVLGCSSPPTSRCPSGHLSAVGMDFPNTFLVLVNTRIH